MCREASENAQTAQTYTTDIHRKRRGDFGVAKSITTND